METLEQLITKIQNLRRDFNQKVLSAAEDSIRASTKENFERGGYTNDGAVKKWHDRYGYDHIEKQFGNVEHLLPYKKGDRTGRMKRLRSQKSNSSLKIGSDAPYAKTFQEGGTYFDGKVFRGVNATLATGKPKFLYQKQDPRPFLGFGDKNIRDVHKSADKIIEEALK